MNKEIIITDNSNSIPEADSGSVNSQPYTAPVVVSSDIAEKEMSKHYAELSRLTGREYTL